MDGNRSTLLNNGLDGLRLFGLGRVPRCAGCPRYEALLSAYERRNAGRRGLPPGLPSAPADCSYQYCAPLAGRYLFAPTVIPAEQLISARPSSERKLLAS